MNDLYNIRTFSQRYEAEILKSLLAEHGIESIISADDCGSMRPDLAFARGVRLLIKNNDAEKAIEILKSFDNE